MPKVFVACHNPSLHGKVTWEGHDIVGYVDVMDGGDASYYKGWDSVPTSLRGTIDIVLSLGCPVALPFRSGHLTTFDSVSAEDAMFFGQQTQEIVTNGFALLKPGGYLLFPRITVVDPVTIKAMEALPPGKNTAELIDIPKPRWIRHRQSDEYDVNEDYSKDVLKGLKLTKAATGGRRKKTKRRAQKKKRTLRR